MSGAICGITANEHPRMSLRSSGLRLPPFERSIAIGIQ